MNYFVKLIAMNPPRKLANARSSTNFLYHCSSY